MSIFYRSETITPGGLISLHPFELPADGRRVQFCMDASDARNILIYTVIDGEVTRFDNGAQLETPIRGAERLIRYRPHTAFALAVQKTHLKLEQTVSIPPVLVRCDSGESVLLPVSAAVTAEVYVRDPDRLVEDYLDGCVTDVTDALSRSLAEVIRRSARLTVSRSLRRQEGDNVDAVLDGAADEIEGDAARRMREEYPWLGIRCTVTLTAENLDTLLSAVNRPFTIRVEMARRMFDAALDACGREPLPAEISRLLIAYVQTNPGATEEQLTRLLENAKKIYARTTPEQFLKAAAELFPALKNGGLKYAILP